jgi:hypothetical protein
MKLTMEDLALFDIAGARERLAEARRSPHADARTFSGNIKMHPPVDWTAASPLNSCVLPAQEGASQ